ncbi:MAG: helix-turn-helix domain-containing protein, partial [Myxococcaceae bacterium]
PKRAEEPATPLSPDWAELQRQRDALDTKEREVIAAALTAAGGNVSKAARALGLPRTSLLSRLASLGIPRE